MEKYDWNIVLAGAHPLGIDAAKISRDQTKKTIINLFNGEYKLTVEQLIEEMCEQIEYKYEHNEILMNAFVGGFLGDGGFFV